MTCMVGLVKRRCNTCGVDHAGTVRNSDESVRERLLPKQVQLRMNSVSFTIPYLRNNRTHAYICGGLARCNSHAEHSRGVWGAARPPLLPAAPSSHTTTTILTHCHHHQLEVLPMGGVTEFIRSCTCFGSTLVHVSTLAIVSTCMLA